MLHFDAEAGLIHLLFANDDDDYYSAGYVRLDLYSYLFGALLAGGYQSVFFFNAKSVLYAADDHSGAVFEAASEKRRHLFASHRTHAAADAPQRFRVRRMQPLQPESAPKESPFAAAVRQLVTLMNRSDRAAVVMPLGVFTQLGALPELADELAQIARKNAGAGKRHVLIVTVPVYAQASAELFDPHTPAARAGSVFAGRLFPKLERVFPQDENYYIYDRLKAYFGSRMQFANDLGCEQLRRMLLHHLLQSRSITEVSLQTADRWAQVLWGWYHLPDFAAAVRLPLASDPGRLMRNVERSLACSPALCDAVEACAAELEARCAPGMQITDFLKAQYPADPDTARGIWIADAGTTQETDALAQLSQRSGSRALRGYLALLHKPCRYGGTHLPERERMIAYALTHAGNLNTRLIGYLEQALGFWFDCFETDHYGDFANDQDNAKNALFVLYEQALTAADVLADASAGHAHAALEEALGRADRCFGTQVTARSAPQLLRPVQEASAALADALALAGSRLRQEQSGQTAYNEW